MHVKRLISSLCEVGFMGSFLIFPLKLVYEGRPEDLDVEKIKGLFIEKWLHI